LDEKDCIEVSDTDEKWLICSNDAELLKKMTCSLQTLFGEKCEGEQYKEEKKKLKILQPLMIIPLPSPDCATDWNYNFHG
jgi:hypothetical protein